MSMVQKHKPSLDLMFTLALCFGLLFVEQTASENTRCHTEHSWISSGGNEFGYEALNEEMCGSSSTCGNKYPKPEGLEDRPPPVENKTVELSFFGIVLDPTKNSTCLGITYTLNRYGASKVKGVQFLLHGLGYNSHNTECCQVLNYTVELNYEAVVINPNSGEPLPFHFDCFCDLWPLERYKLTIRTLPVDFDNQTLLDPSSIVRDFKVPGCASLEWDQYCQKSREELWKPQLLLPEQLFPEYMKLKVSFNIAPTDYRFVEYVISVYEVDVPRPLYTQVAQTPLISTPVMVNGMVMDVTSLIFTLSEEDIGKSLHVSMFPKCDEGEPDCNTPTYVDKTNIVEIIANPCDTDPCGDLGSCEPLESQYLCMCNENAILDEHPIYEGDTCIENPCNSNPCGSLGACDLDGVQYYCNCTSTAIYNGITCITDPCHSNPCDKYSTCRHNEDFEPECYCTEGITCIVDECHVEELEHSNCITLATCEESSLDLTTGWKHHDCKCRYDVINGTNVTNVCQDGSCDERTCDANVHCNYIDMPGGVRYNCSCAPGYAFNEVGQCEKDRKPYLWMIVVVAVVLVVVALIVGFRFIIKAKPEEMCGKKIPYNDDISTSPSTPPEPNLNNHLHDESTEDPRPYERVPEAYMCDGAECASKRILIISTEETEEHRDVVYKFAIFLKTYAGLLPIIPSQHTNEIHKLTLETWLSEENRQAFKVLFICSQGMQRRWEQERKADPNLDSGNPVESAFGDLFIQMKHITSTERRKPGMLHKFVVAFFGDYISKSMVEDIDLFRGMPCFNLMTDIEKLCFLLNGIEQYTPTSNRRMPYIKRYESVPEGQALFGAIGLMAGKCGASFHGRDIARQLSSKSASNPNTPTSEGSGVSEHFELNSQEDGFEFQQIPENDQQAMTSALDFFSHSVGSDDRSSRSSSVLYQVDVHRESSDDADFPQAISENLNEPHSLDKLDSGLSSLPMSRLSSQEDGSPGYVTSLDDFVVHVPTKHEDNLLDSGLHSQPQSLA